MVAVCDNGWKMRRLLSHALKFACLGVLAFGVSAASILYGCSAKAEPPLPVCETGNAVSSPSGIGCVNTTVYGTEILQEILKRNDIPCSVWLSNRPTEGPNGEFTPNDVSQAWLQGWVLGVFSAYDDFDKTHAIESTAYLYIIHQLDDFCAENPGFSFRDAVRLLAHHEM